MTLNELAVFVRAAKEAGATGAELIDARTTLGGKLTTVTVNIKRSVWIEQDDDSDEAW